MAGGYSCVTCVGEVVQGGPSIQGRFSLERGTNSLLRTVLVPTRCVAHEPKCIGNVHSTFRGREL